MTNDLAQYKWVFMGTPQIAVDFLTELKNTYSLLPDLLVTVPDVPVGRKQVLTASPTKKFALKNDIKFLETRNLDDVSDQLQDFDFFCVFAFSMLLKQRHLDLPRHGVVNLHPSLLPQYRGAAPIVAAILDDQKNTGVTLMQIERGMDSGPIIAQKKCLQAEWFTWDALERTFAIEGAHLFYKEMPNYLSGETTPCTQDNDLATYCHKFHKSDMQINLEHDQYRQYRTYCAFPKPFIISDGVRYVVSLAHWDDTNHSFVVEKVIPEGKSERTLEQSNLASKLT